MQVNIFMHEHIYSVRLPSGQVGHREGKRPCTQCLSSSTTSSVGMNEAVRLQFWQLEST